MADSAALPPDASPWHGRRPDSSFDIVDNTDGEGDGVIPWARSSRSYRSYRARRTVRRSRGAWPVRSRTHGDTSASSPLAMAV